MLVATEREKDFPHPRDLNSFSKTKRIPGESWELLKIINFLKSAMTDNVISLTFLKLRCWISATEIENDSYHLVPTYATFGESVAFIMLFDSQLPLALVGTANHQ